MFLLLFDSFDQYYPQIIIQRSVILLCKLNRQNRLARNVRSKSLCSKLNLEPAELTSFFRGDRCRTGCPRCTSTLIEKFRGVYGLFSVRRRCSSSAGYSSSLRDHRSLASLILLPTRPFFLSPGRLTFSSRASPSLEPLKWQSFLRRRPVETKRGECSTGSSLGGSAVFIRCHLPNERTGRMNITGRPFCSSS